MSNDQFKLAKDATVNNYGYLETYYNRSAGVINNYGNWVSKYDPTKKEYYFVNRGGATLYTSPLCQDRKTGSLRWIPSLA